MVEQCCIACWRHGFLAICVTRDPQTLSSTVHTVVECTKCTMYQYTTTSFKLSTLVFEIAPALRGANARELLPSLLHLSAPCGRSFLNFYVPFFLLPQGCAFLVVTYLLLPKNAKSSLLLVSMVFKIPSTFRVQHCPRPQTSRSGSRAVSVTENWSFLLQTC
jgi:hypothetical protein